MAKVEERRCERNMNGAELPQRSREITQMCRQSVHEETKNYRVSDELPILLILIYLVPGLKDKWIYFVPGLKARWIYFVLGLKDKWIYFVPGLKARWIRTVIRMQQQRFILPVRHSYGFRVLEMCRIPVGRFCGREMDFT